MRNRTWHLLRYLLTTFLLITKGERCEWPVFLKIDQEGPRKAGTSDRLEGLKAVMSNAVLDLMEFCTCEVAIGDAVAIATTSACRPWVGSQSLVPAPCPDLDNPPVLPGEGVFTLRTRTQKYLFSNLFSSVSGKKEFVGTHRWKQKEMGVREDGGSGKAGAARRRPRIWAEADSCSRATPPLLCLTSSNHFGADPSFFRKWGFLPDALWTKNFWVLLDVKKLCWCRKKTI